MFGGFGGTVGLRPGGFAGTVGLRSPRPRQGGGGGCALSALWKRWACAAHTRGKGADGACAPRGPLASPGSPSISRHPGETPSNVTISEAPLAHPFGTGPAGLAPNRLYRSFVYQLFRGVAGACDGWCTKDRAPRVPREAWARGVSEIEEGLVVSHGSPSSHRGGAGGCKGAARGAAPSAPLPRVWAAQAHRFHKADRAQPPPPPCRGRGLRKPTIPAKPPGRRP
jgi:hypothetical protein